MYSDYYYSLDVESASRYREKVGAIGVDPYTVKLEVCSTKTEDFPHVLYPDIVNYLVYEKSAYTHDDFKAFKALEAYKQASYGWVKKIAVKKYGENIILVLAKVMHSQKLNQKLLSPWISAKADGRIIYAHCDCMAGLGETCTHVAAVLFKIDMLHRKSPTPSVTEVQSYWTAPAKLADPYRVADIDFTAPSTSKVVNDAPVFIRGRIAVQVPALSSKEIHSVLSTLLDTKRGSVLHTIVAPFSEEISHARQAKKSHMLSCIYKLEYEQESLEKLREIGAQLDLAISIDACKNLEKDTDQQARSKAWFDYRAGRITASKFKQSCRTPIEKPSISLIKSICYPASTKIKTKATIYGCVHEKEALQMYSAKMQKLHADFGSQPVGFCIRPQYPHFGASPDGLIECVFCGLGCVEIKCPYCAKDLNLEDLNTLKKFGLEEKEGEIHLRSDHKYYYQVQMQLAITGLGYCDFIVWNKNQIYQERITLNKLFWEKESKTATIFFKNVIFPELLGQYYTRKVDANEWCL